MDFMIELKQISKRYPNPGVSDGQIRSELGDFLALNDISLSISQGDVVGIIGRNGAGKTTLLNILAGVLSPTQGQVFTKGRVLGLFNLGVGFQDELTGRENIFLNGALLGALKKEIEQKINAILEFSELGDFIDMPLGTYSQGMRLRLGFSIIANLDFDILVVDEVLAVGDALFQSKCFERLMDFRRSGKTLVITTQNMELIERLCDKALLLDHGRLIFYGNIPETLIKYRSLLISERFFVGPAREDAILVENTKKWADDVSEWGKKLGTKEAVIKSVKIYNRWGIQVDKVKCGAKLRIKVDFEVKNAIKDSHFGAAIFRNDGVYCYGPNTLFDEHTIKKLNPGKGWFSIEYENIPFASGDYKISVGIWDNKETLPFDYHCGCYNLRVEGGGIDKGALVSISCSARPGMFKKSIPAFPDHCALEPDIALSLCDQQMRKKNVFKTNEPARVVAFIHDGSTSGEHLQSWIGFFRNDDVYCQGFSFPNKGTIELNFPHLPFLPGQYRIAVGIWDSKLMKFIAFKRDSLMFRMVFDRKDHGTLHIKHRWKWRLP